MRSSNLRLQNVPSPIRGSAGLSERVIAGDSDGVSSYNPISGAEVNVKIDVTHTILRLTNKRVGLQGRAERMLVSGHGPLKVNKRKRSHRERESRRSQSVSTRVAGLWGRWPSRLVRRLPVVGICRCRRRRAHRVEPWL
jgi:hypothetical protein